MSALIRAPPRKLQELPRLLCTDAIQDIRKSSMEQIQTATSAHPFTFQAFTKVASLTVDGASAITVEVDGRTTLPLGTQLVARNRERAPYAWKVLYTPHPTRPGSGGVISLPGDTAHIYIESVPGQALKATGSCWGWGVRVSGESWDPPPEDEVMRAPLPSGWSLMRMMLNDAPNVLKAPEVFTLLYDL